MNKLTFKLELEANREISKEEITQLHNHFAKYIQKAFRGDAPEWCYDALSPKVMLNYVRSARDKENIKAKECINAISDGTGIELTKQQLEWFLHKYDHVNAEVDRWGASDTVVSGQLSDMISKELIGRNWPTYGDKVDMDSFYEELHREATNRGYKTIDR